MKQLPLPLSWVFSKDVKDFVVSDCNRYAFEWLEKWPFKIHSNVICLVGEKGSGKTHLAHIWAEKMGADFIGPTPICNELFDIPIEQMSNKFFVLDDADEINDDMFLFYLFNIINSLSAYLLLTAKKTPNTWNLQYEDVRSRLSTVDIVRIDGPDDSVINSIISKMLQQRGLMVSDDVVIYIANRIERSYASIAYWINKIDTLQIDKSHKLSIHSIKELFLS